MAALGWELSAVVQRNLEELLGAVVAEFLVAFEAKAWFEVVSVGVEFVGAGGASDDLFDLLLLAGSLAAVVGGRGRDGLFAQRHGVEGEASGAKLVDVISRLWVRRKPVTKVSERGKKVQALQRAVESGEGANHNFSPRRRTCCCGCWLALFTAERFSAGPAK